MAKKIKHVGFKGAQKKVEGEGYGADAAAKIVAAATRKASASAKKANPKLKKVKGAVKKAAKKADAAY